MKILKHCLLYLLVIFPVVLFATSTRPPEWEAVTPITPEAKENILKSFRFYKNVSPSVLVPTVVEVPFSDPVELPFFAVYNVTTSSFEPNSFAVSLIKNRIRPNTTAPTAIGYPFLINDENYESYVEFPLSSDVSKAEITFNFDRQITTSSLSFVLDNYVAMPNKISIETQEGGRRNIVLAPTKPTAGTVFFPKTTSSVWSVSLEYVQPLRISEMNFNDLSPQQTKMQNLRFLAQPAQTYQIYFDADRYTSIPLGESGNLTLDQDVVHTTASSVISNPKYMPSDKDVDGVPDLYDNCVSVANSDQLDLDRNGRGDACEDYDRDGVVNSVDNCRDIPNAYQEDTEQDGVGDVCDGQDNRVTERMPWLPWMGIAIAGIVLLGLFVITIKHPKTDLP